MKPADPARADAGSDRPVRPGPARWIAFSAVFALAVLLRFQGLFWGLPDARHWLSYHPDEIMVLSAADRVNLFAGAWDPGFYHYGSLLIYLISVSADVLNAWVPLPQDPAPWVVLARLTMIGRVWTAVFGVATVYVAWLMGRRVAGERAGLFAAAVMTVLPMHAVHSHYVAVDVPATFWVSVALYNALRWPHVRAALWCGIAAGLAAGTKYNAALSLFAGWAAVALAREIPARQRWSGAAAMTGAAALAFLITTPGVLLAADAFWRDFGFETAHVRAGHGLVFVDTGPGWWYHIATNLRQGVGAPIPLAAAVALAFAWPRISRAAWRPALAMLAFCFPYFALISAAAVRFQRYDMPLLPALALGAGALFTAAGLRGRALGAAAILGTAFLAQGQVSTMSAPRGVIQVVDPLYRGDPRDAVARWLARRLKSGVTLGLISAPWFYTPPIIVANGGPQSRELFQEACAGLPFRILLPDAHGETAYTEWPDIIVLSDYEIADALRLQGATPPERYAHIRPVTAREGAPEEARRLTLLWNNIVKRYDVVGVWSPAPHALGIRWAKRTLPPHDAFYSYPTLFVFVRKGPGSSGAT